MSVISTLFFCSALISTTFSAVTNLGLSKEWVDSVNCDLTDWSFHGDATDEAKARYRNGGQDGITTCMYGEYGVDNDYIERTFTSDWASYEVIVEMRIWSFCEAEAGEVYTIDILVDGEETDQSAVLTQGRNDDYSCDNWDCTVNEDCDDGTFSWYNENDVACSAEHPSCYEDIDTISKPVLIKKTNNEFTIRIGSELNAKYTNEAWAVSDIKVLLTGTIPASLDESTCCTGDSRWGPIGSDGKGKGRCSRLHEQTNCEAKLCTWDEQDPECQVKCCRHDINGNYGGDVRKKCKALNFKLEEACEDDSRCSIQNCDEIGFRDGDEVEVNRS